MAAIYPTLVSSGDLNLIGLVPGFKDLRLDATLEVDALGNDDLSMLVEGGLVCFFFWVLAGAEALIVCNPNLCFLKTDNAV